jgi:TolB-like protein
MAEGDGIEKSSEAASDPPGASASASTTHAVFLSYASHDAGVAKSICEYLEGHGVSCWMAPRDVPAGALYADAIVRAINEAKALVVVLSQSAVASSHVGKEIERASSKNKKIIAFRIDPAPLTPALEYFLSESQWIDVPALGMPAAVAKLKEAVGKGSSAQSRPVSDAKPDQPAGKKTRRVAVIAAAIAIGVGVAVALGVHFWSSNHRAQEAMPAAKTDKSIAVLPFVDMSEKKDQEYFADGMAEEILDQLVKIPELTVIGRTSSFQFKGKNGDLRKIGAELGAAYVLEGSVRKSGDQIRITTQLINTKTGAHEWSETYDRHIGDVLKLQDAIAAAVARELQLTVSPGYLTRPTVKSAEAYNLILRGRHAADRWDKDGLDEAAALFRQALDLDATSADAAAELAFTFYQQGVFIFLPSSTAFEQARRAAETALNLDPKSARAHYVLGKIHLVYDWDWAAAEREFQQSSGLAPGSADVLSGQARVSLTLGRWDDALRQIRAALARDPLDANSFEYLALNQARRGHLPEAEVAIRRLLDIRSTYGWGHYYLGAVLLARGDRNRALLAIQQETVDDSQQTGLAIVYYALGRKADSDAALNRLLKEYADGRGSATEIALVYAFRAQSDEAMHWLERAYVQKDADLYRIKFDLPVTNLEQDPRYKAFLRKMNLPE